MVAVDPKPPRLSSTLLLLTAASPNLLPGSIELWNGNGPVAGTKISAPNWSGGTLSLKSPDGTDGPPVSLDLLLLLAAQAGGVDLRATRSPRLVFTF